MVSEEQISAIREGTDELIGKAILLGIGKLLQAGATPEQLCEFATTMVNIIRLAEVGRVPIRDMGAN
jgi:hypothetical protein